VRVGVDGDKRRERARGHETQSAVPRDALEHSRATRDRLPWCRRKTVRGGVSGRASVCATQILRVPHLSLGLRGSNDVGAGDDWWRKAHGCSQRVRALVGSQYFALQLACTSLSLVVGAFDSLQNSLEPCPTCIAVIIGSITEGAAIGDASVKT
jgi:hypothetical protein